MDDSDPDLLPEGLEDRLPHEAAAGQRVMRAMTVTSLSNSRNVVARIAMSALNIPG